MINTDGKFYLGRTVDSTTKQSTDEKLFYDPEDLTTHAVIVGMTGSGKTGLCIDLMEEAALNNVPAIMIDIKGDITNALLHFPNMLPEDFAPWVNPDEARRNDKTIDEAARDAANLWKNGLESWDIDLDRMRRLDNAAQFAVYTPGSTSGIPISILSSLQAPKIDWDANREIIRDRIGGTVTAILGLVGFKDLDPVRSQEHILLSNIFEKAWSAGQDLSLSELIMQVQNPPFEKLGVFEVDRFFPEKDRFSLAMALNNILAAPGFQTWVEGVPLDIDKLTMAEDGRPRHSVIYLAHLSDEERMFFVTLLFAAVETWMRALSGTTSLRALIYFDEIFGYLPAGMSNPPSKEPMLRMLKQARAFGVGLVLATQNPVDVDYKALSNAGTWFIGRLQTERDKERLLDGLEGASGTGLDRREFDKLLSTLGKRVFLLHNVHERVPQLFQTRWAMNYLAGPLTRNHIPALNALAGATVNEPTVTTPTQPAVTQPRREYAAAPAAAAVGEQDAPAEETSLEGSLTRPKVPTSADEYFLPYNQTLSQALRAYGRDLPDVKELGVLYRPTLLSQVDIRFINRKYNLDHDKQWTALVQEPDPRGRVRWEDFEAPAISSRDMDRDAALDARFATLDVPLSDTQMMSALKRDIVDWVYRNVEVTVRAHETLKVYAGPDRSQAEFRTECAEMAREQRDAEIEKETTAFDKKKDALVLKLKKEERDLDMDEDTHDARKREELLTHAETLIGLFGKSKRRVSTSLTKRRMTQQAKARVTESIETIKMLEEQITKLEQEKTEALEKIKERWSEMVDDATEIKVAPYKKDILVDLFGVAWFPYIVVEAESRTHYLPGYAHS